MDEVITLIPSIKSYYKVLASRQLTPLKLKIIFRSSNTNLHFYFSRVIEKPNKDYYELKMMVQGRASCLSYKSGNDKRFSEGYIYFTIEAESNCYFVLKAGFGEMCFHRTNASEVVEHVIDTYKDGDDSLSFLSTRPRTIRLHIKRTKKPLILIKNHRKGVIWKSEEKDYKERIKKFISSNRIELKKRLIEIAKQKVKHVNILKTLMILWVYFIKTIKIAKYSFVKFVNYKRRKAENERRIFKAIRIYTFLRVYVASDSLGYRNRLHSRISA
jgi:hypothetical protein